MSIKINKKNIKILIAVIVAILIILIGVFVAPIINTNLKIKNTESKLNQIKAKDFENELIEEFKKSPLNINNDTIKTTFGKLDDIDNNASLEMKASIGFTKMNGEEYYKSKYEDLENFVYAYILEYKSNKIDNYIVVPLFKIESDSNGNFQSIEYMDASELYFIEPIIKQTIKEVLEKDYNIDTSVIKSYDETQKVRYTTSSKEMEMYITDTRIDTNIDKWEFGAKVFTTISNNMNGKYGAYSFKEKDYYNIANSPYSSVGFFFTTKTLKID